MLNLCQDLFRLVVFHDALDDDVVPRFPHLLPDFGVQHEDGLAQAELLLLQSHHHVVVDLGKNKAK